MATAEKNDEAPNSAPLGAMGSLLRRLDMFPCTDDGGSISELKDYIHSISNKLKKLSEVQDPPLTVNYWMKHVRELSDDIEAYLDDLDAQTDDNLNYSNAKKEDNPVDSDAKLEDCIDDSDEKTEYADDLYAMMEDYIDDSDDETKDSVDDSDGSIQESICSSDYKISGFRTRAKGMIERYKSFSLDSVLSSPTATTTIVSPRPSRDVVLIDMGNQISKLISLLQPKDENDNQLKIVSILGDEGIGKSTLIQEIWHESFKERKIWPEPQSEVKIKRAFVGMGKKPDVRMILRSILSQISLQEPDKDSGVTNLIQDIRKHLEQKRYFIIVDDVGSLSVWDVVGRAFPHGSFGSRIITTTSDKEVAMACCSYVLQHNYTMEPLGVGDCKELFIRTVGLGTVDLQLCKQVSDEIKRKCGGLPLAIIWTAILMASKLETEQELSRTEKEQNLDSDVKKFLDANLRTGLTPVEILNQVLKLCYSSLPHYLKTCLLYLSLYPENYIFLKEDLVKVWMAEDFICTSEEDKVEAAGRYFDVLVSLGLIQRMDINCNKQHHQGEVAEDNEEEYPLRVPYVVHPTVFDFIICKSTEDNFITIIDSSQLTVVLKEKIRRLSLHFGSATYASTPVSIGLSHVRTLSFMGLLSCMPSLVEFKLVRVVILHLWDDDRDKKFSLAEICRLHLLRYLQVRCNLAVELPCQIGCLKHLETLEINSVVTAVPSDVFHLPRLLYLRLGLKQNLTLGPVAAVKAISSDELLPPMDDSSSTSASIPSVQIFELLLPICIFSRLPMWIPQLYKLSILEIVVRELLSADIDMLADLPALTALSLYVRIPTARNIVFRRGAFPALMYLRFMCGVLSLDFQQEAMPNLRRLLIGFNVRRREKYDYILAGIQHLLKLQEVVASIGATMGTEETDRIAAESALKDAIYKHAYSTKFIVKRVLKVEEEYRPTPFDRLSINEQEEVPVIHGLQSEDSTNEQPINLDKVPGKNTHEHANLRVPQFLDLQDDDNSSAQHKSGSRSSRVVSALSKAQLQDGYVSYTWEKKMSEVLPISSSSSFLSLLVLPMALDRAGSCYNSVEDTLARANAWILSSQATGVPIAFLNVQTEALLTKISGETASSTVHSGSLADLPNLANASLYVFEDYHGVDIGVVKAVRVWYTAAAGEMPVDIILEEGDARLGFAISRTEEGFIYVSSVVENDVKRQEPSTRSGLCDLYLEAKRASKLLVISRVSGQMVLPWMVSTSGAIRCFDTVSLSQRLSQHRRALRPILLHVLMWDSKSAGSRALPQRTQ